MLTDARKLLTQLTQRIKPHRDNHKIEMEQGVVLISVSMVYVWQEFELSDFENESRTIDEICDFIVDYCENEVMDEPDPNQLPVVVDLAVVGSSPLM